MSLFIGGCADGTNIDVVKVNGRPLEEVRLSHFSTPPTKWVLQYEGPTFPKVDVDVYHYRDGEYRFERTE